MFENLTDKLERSFKILKGEGRITEINVAETLREIRRALCRRRRQYKVIRPSTDNEGEAEGAGARTPRPSSRAR